MRKAIDGKLYDTEAAEEVASGGNGLYGSDFNHYRWVLYKTKSDRYFLYEVGGPMSKMSRPAGGGGMTGGSDITAMSDDEAVSWLERHNEVSALEQEFPDYLEPA